MRFRPQPSIIWCFDLLDIIHLLSSHRGSARGGGGGGGGGFGFVNGISVYIIIIISIVYDISLTSGQFVTKLPWTG